MKYPSGLDIVHSFVMAVLVIGNILAVLFILTFGFQLLTSCGKEQAAAQPSPKVTPTATYQPTATPKPTKTPKPKKDGKDDNN